MIVVFIRDDMGLKSWSRCSLGEAQLVLEHVRDTYSAKRKATESCSQDYQNPQNNIKLKILLLNVAFKCYILTIVTVL